MMLTPAVPVRASPQSTSILPVVHAHRTIPVCFSLSKKKRSALYCVQDQSHILTLKLKQHGRINQPGMHRPPCLLDMAQQDLIISTASIKSLGVKE
jgi:hypothetical protein